MPDDTDESRWSRMIDMVMTAIDRRPKKASVAQQMSMRDAQLADMIAQRVAMAMRDVVGQAMAAYVQMQQAEKAQETQLPPPPPQLQQPMSPPQQTMSPQVNPTRQARMDGLRARVSGLRA